MEEIKFLLSDENMVRCVVKVSYVVKNGFFEIFLEKQKNPKVG